MTIEKSEGREFDPHPGHMVLLQTLHYHIQAMGIVVIWSHHDDITNVATHSVIVKMHAPGEARTHNLRIA